MSRNYGRFVWFELLTKKLDQAKAFYPETLPWKIIEAPMQDGSTYPMITVGDRGVGGLMTPPGDVPTAWVSYVSVEDVDATARKIEAAGGSLHVDAFDMPGVGRIQPVSDAQGGMFALFHAETEDPAPIEGPGSFHWNELWTQEPEASLAFYEKVLEYHHDEMPMPNGTYYILKSGNEMRGGMLRAPSADIPTMWLQYVAVQDCDETLKRARSKGAAVVADPVDAPPGRFAVLRDPLGAIIGVIQPSDG